MTAAVIDRFGWARGIDLATIMGVSHPTDVVTLAKMGFTGGDKNAGNSYRKLFVQWLRDGGKTSETEEKLYDRLKCLANPSLVGPYQRFSDYEGLQRFFYAHGFVEFEAQLRELKTAIKGDRIHWSKGSEREAAAEFAKEVTKQAFKKQAQKDGMALDELANLANEHYKRTMFQAVAEARANFKEAAEIDPDAYGALATEAVPLLEAAHTRVSSESGKLKAAELDFVKDQHNEDLEAKLLDAFNAFTEAVNGELDAIAQAAGICVTCAQKHLIHQQSENFNTAHAKVGMGLIWFKFSMSMLATSVSTFAAPWGGQAIGAALQLASIAVTEATKYFVVKADSQDYQKVMDTVGKSYRTDKQDEQRKLILNAVAQGLGCTIPEARAKIRMACSMKESDLDKYAKRLREKGEQLEDKGDLEEIIEQIETAHQVLEIIHKLADVVHITMDVIIKCLEIAEATKALWESALKIAGGALAGAGYALAGAGLVIDLANWKAAQDKALKADFEEEEMEQLTSTVAEAFQNQLGNGLFDTKRIILYSKSGADFIVGFITSGGEIIKGKWSLQTRRFSPDNRKPIVDALTERAQRVTKDTIGKHGLFEHELTEAVVDWGSAIFSDDERSDGLLIDDLMVTVKRKDPGQHHQRDGEYEFSKVLLTWEGELHWLSGTSKRVFVRGPAPNVAPVTATKADVQNRLQKVKEKSLVGAQST